MTLSPSTEYGASQSLPDLPRLALGSARSAGRCHTLFASFTATMATSDFSKLYIIGFEFLLLSVAASHDSEAV